MNMILSSGKVVELTELTPGDICYVDVLNGLRCNVRYSGQAGPRATVAVHSILVSMLACELHGTRSASLIVHALLHDAAEAYLGEIPSGVKDKVTGFREIEDRTVSVIYKALNIPEPTDEQRAIIKKADKTAPAYEIPYYYNSSRTRWEIEKLNGKFTPVSYDTASHYMTRAADVGYAIELEDACKTAGFYLRKP